MVTKLFSGFSPGRLILVGLLSSAATLGCLDGSTEAGSVPLAERPQNEAGAAIDQGESEDLPEEGTMSTTCTSADDALGFAQALAREDFLVFVTREVAIVREISVVEELPNGRLTGTAWEVALGDPDQVFGQNAKDVVDEARAIVMRSQNTVFQFHGGGRFREAECGRASSVDDAGSLGDRMELAQGQSVALLMQRTAEWGWIVRGLTTVSDGALHVNTSADVPLYELEEADANARTRRGFGEIRETSAFEIPPVPAVPPGVCPPGGCDAPL